MRTDQLRRPLSTAKTSIRPGKDHEWEALIVRRLRRRYLIVRRRHMPYKVDRRQHTPYKIKISGRAHLHMFNEIHVQPSPTHSALTLDGARRRGQRMARALHSRCGLEIS
jgi:hypothetical protein